MNDEYYMQMALEEAAEAAKLGEVPIGAVVVVDRPALQEYSRIPRDEQLMLLRRYARLAGRVPCGVDADSLGGEELEALDLPQQLVVARAHNRREIDRDPSSHAEFSALVQASKAMNAWRLAECTVYVTLEPCVMCAGLMQQSRVKRCVFGAYDPKGGALGSLYRINEDDRLNHVFEVVGGVCEDDCVKIMKDFFAMRREQAKERKRQAKLEASNQED